MLPTPVASKLCRKHPRAFCSVSLPWNTFQEMLCGPGRQRALRFQYGCGHRIPRDSVVLDLGWRAHQNHSWLLLAVGPGMCILRVPREILIYCLYGLLPPASPRAGPLPRVTLSLHHTPYSPHAKPLGLLGDFHTLGVDWVSHSGVT